MNIRMRVSPARSGIEQVVDRVVDGLSYFPGEEPDIGAVLSAFHPRGLVIAKRDALVAFATAEDWLEDRRSAARADSGCGLFFRRKSVSMPGSEYGMVRVEVEVLRTRGRSEIARLRACWRFMFEPELGRLRIRRLAIDEGCPRDGEAR